MKKMIVIVLGLLIFATQGFSTEKSVSLATLNWAPYVGENLKNKGFTSKIVTEAFKRKGYEVNFKFLPWTMVLKSVGNGQYDAGFPAHYTEKIAKQYAVSKPFAENTIGFYKKKNKKIPFKVLEDLEPYKIGVVQGYVNSAEFDAASYLEKKVAKNDNRNLQKLLKNQIDLAVIDKIVAQNIMNTSMSQDEKDRLEFIKPALDVKKLYLIISLEIKNSRQILEDFNSGLDEIEQDGTIEKIMKEYGFDH